MEPNCIWNVTDWTDCGSMWKNMDRQKPKFLGIQPMDCINVWIDTKTRGDWMISGFDGPSVTK